MYDPPFYAIFDQYSLYKLTRREFGPFRPIPSWLCLVYPFGLTRLTLSRIRLGRGICGRYVQSPREHRSCSSEAGSEDRSFRPKTRRTVSMAGMPLGPSNAQGIGRPASSQKRALMGLS